MNRNPLVAVLTISLLALSGCGSARLMTPAKALAPATRISAQAALALEKREFPTPDANKDWKVITGKVSKILPDDLNGSKHQHFLFVANGKTLKVAHNIDLAPHVPVEVGGDVEVKCEFIRSKPYDVAHWTHYDPAGGEGGYIKYAGKVYDRNELN